MPIYEGSRVWACFELKFRGTNVYIFPSLGTWSTLLETGHYKILVWPIVLAIWQDIFFKGKNNALYRSKGYIRSIIVWNFCLTYKIRGRFNSTSRTVNNRGQQCTTGQAQRPAAITHVKLGPCSSWPKRKGHNQVCDLKWIFKWKLTVSGKMHLVLCQTPNFWDRLICLMNSKH